VYGISLITRKDSERLIRYGFFDDKHNKAHLFIKKDSDARLRAMAELSDHELEDIALHEKAEETQLQIMKTKFPKPKKRFRLWWENFNLSVEEAYFWTLEHMKTKCAMPYIVKTEDVFSAAENSAFFGVSQQRIGLQQDKVSQFLATIGKMVKELFQLVRELRIIDERTEYYQESYTASDNKKATASEITLKGIYIDMVEGGAKNPASVYGMARELQFATLPDLFFSTQPRQSSDVNRVVDALLFNDMVKRVLKRKLYAYLKWKEHTYEELRNRREFTLKYLNQHWEVIRMYMNWVRPYLRHVKRLTMDEDKMRTPDLISAFEGSLIEIEFLAYQLPIGQLTEKAQGEMWQAAGGRQNHTMYACVLAHFLFRTRPGMSYQQEGYNRGPLHIGRMQLDLRSYVWTKGQIDNYIKMKDSEDLELMKTISGSVKAAMEALGDELIRYLDEAKGKYEKKVKSGHGGHGHDDHAAHRPGGGFFEPFTAPFKGIADVVKSVTGKGHGHGDHGHGGGHDQGDKYHIDEKEVLIASERVKWCLFETYKNFKKEHKMYHWD
jgi:hypothetical protein